MESTIESHLCLFVEDGTIAIAKLLSPEQQEVITKELAVEKENSLGAVKKRLGEEYSYGQINMMLAHQKFTNVTAE